MLFIISKTFWGGEVAFAFSYLMMGGYPKGPVTMLNWGVGGKLEGIRRRVDLLGCRVQSTCEKGEHRMRIEILILLSKFVYKGCSDHFKCKKFSRSQYQLSCLCEGRRGDGGGGGGGRVEAERGGGAEFSTQAAEKRKS